MSESAISVLLVEDNPLDAETIIRQLRSDPITQVNVTTVETLDAAHAALTNKRFDAALLDLALPDSIGLASLHSILNQHPEVPVVVLTGLEDPEIAIRALEEGAQDYLTKRHLEGDAVGRSLRYAVARQRSQLQLGKAHDELEVMRDRERIARDLHDTVIQQLYATGISLQTLAHQPSDMSSENKDRFDHAVEIATTGIDGAMTSLREAIFDIQRASAGRGLVDAIRLLCVRQGEALGFEPSVTIRSSARELDNISDHQLRHDVLAVVSEALSNVAQHANASTADVELSFDKTSCQLMVSVSDDGRGLNTAVMPGTDSLRGSGLANLVERASSHDGDLSLGTSALGGLRLSWTARPHISD